MCVCVTVWILTCSIYSCRYETDVFSEWVEGVDQVAKTNLEKPLLVRETKDKLDRIAVNFDPEVIQSLNLESFLFLVRYKLNIYPLCI